MKRLALGILFALSLSSGAFATAAWVVPNNPDPMKGYYGNTYVCYWPTWWICHHWWNEDGTETYFSGKWAPEGLITMTTIDGNYRVFYANNQWCATNARTVAPTRAATDDAPPPRAEPTTGPGGAKPDSLDNNENGCAPIVDAVPGNKWFKLHKGDNNFYNFREEYVLMPGHQ